MNTGPDDTSSGRAMPDTVGLNAYLDSPVLAPLLRRWLPEPALAWVRPLAESLGAEAARRPRRGRTRAAFGSRSSVKGWTPDWWSLRCLQSPRVAGRP